MSPDSSEKLDFALISGRDAVTRRCKSVCDNFGYSFQSWPGLEAYLEQGEIGRVVLADCATAATKEGAAEFAQGVRFKAPQCFLICVVADKLDREDAAFIKRSGASLILLEDELFNMSKLEYACTQMVKADFLPIKASDLAVGKTLTFDIYHLLPMRGKFLKCAFEGGDITADKFRKLHEVGELYIKKNSAEAFKSYINSLNDRSSAGLARRCRSQFLALYASYSELVLLLTDKSEHSSFKEGEALVRKCHQLAGELMTALGEFGNAWEIVNNSSIGEFGSTERAPAVAAYAALFGLQVGVDNVDEMMMAALLSDVGLLLLPPGISAKIREGRLEQLNDEERRIYQSYPNKSLEIILERKLPVEEKLRELMLSTHERADGKGFPRGIQGRKLTEAAQLIHFCREFDRRTLIKLGHARVDQKEARAAIIAEELQNPGKFSPVFSEKLRIAFNRLSI